MPSNLNSNTILLTLNNKILSWHSTMEAGFAALNARKGTTLTTWGAYKALQREVA